MWNIGLHVEIPVSEEIDSDCEFIKNVGKIYNYFTEFFLLPLGEAGDWKNWLKVAQSEALDAEVRAADIPLEIKYI